MRCPALAQGGQKAPFGRLDGWRHAFRRALHGASDCGRLAAANPRRCGLSAPCDAHMTHITDRCVMCDIPLLLILLFLYRR